MIQRIQTLFLLLAAAAIGLLFLPELSFASVEGDKTTLQAAAQSMMSDGVFNSYDHVALLVMIGISTALTLASIFMFRNRSQQLRLNRMAMAAGIMIMILTAILFYLDYQMMDSGTYQISIDYGILSPIAFVILVALASRFISKDEKLVRSMDRLR